jgi:hypothetical protein
MGINAEVHCHELGIGANDALLGEAQKHEPNEFRIGCPSPHVYPPVAVEPHPGGVLDITARIVLREIDDRQTHTDSTPIDKCSRLTDDYAIGNLSQLLIRDTRNPAFHCGVFYFRNER